MRQRAAALLAIAVLVAAHGDFGEGSGEGQERKTSARTRRYSKFQTDEGKKYFVPVSGDGKAVWKLPEDATLVTL